jgi:hypothetical protein
MLPLLITLTANHTSARPMQWIIRRQRSPPHCSSHGDEHLQSSEPFAARGSPVATRKWVFSKLLEHSVVTSIRSRFSDSDTSFGKVIGEERRGLGLPFVCPYGSEEQLFWYQASSRTLIGERRIAERQGRWEPSHRELAECAGNRGNDCVTDLDEGEAHHEEIHLFGGLYCKF